MSDPEVVLSRRFKQGRNEYELTVRRHRVGRSFVLGVIAGGGVDVPHGLQGKAARDPEQVMAAALAVVVERPELRGRPVPR